MDHQEAPELWPAPPDLPLPVIMDQWWIDVVFLHWKIPVTVAAAHMPPGVQPDLFDGTAWVGLIGFRMKNAGLGRGPAVPYFGTFNEVNVRLYSRTADGTRGVVFLSLDANRLPVVLAARAAGIPYVWSHIRRLSREAGTAQVASGYRVGRFRRGASSRFSVVPHLQSPVHDPLSVHLTARFGMHGSWGGRTIYVPNSHDPWPLYDAEVDDLQDGLIEAAGITVNGPPDSALYSPGVRSRFGRPYVVK